MTTATKQFELSAEDVQFLMDYVVYNRLDDLAGSLRGLVGDEDGPAAALAGVETASLTLERWVSLLHQITRRQLTDELWLVGMVHEEMQHWGRAAAEDDEEFQEVADGLADILKRITTAA